MAKDINANCAEAIFGRLPPLTRRERGILAAFGVKDPVRYPDFPIRAGFVVFDGLSFEFEQPPGKGPVGTRAIIILERPLGSDSNGLVACDLATGRLASWRGEVSMIVGVGCYWPPASIPIFVSLTDWLRHGRAGMLIIDMTRAPRHLLHWADWLEQPVSFLVQNDQLARNLRRKLKTLVPPVRVQQKEPEVA